MGGFIRMSSGKLLSIELCAGGGGQAIGLEQAGFEHIALVEIDKHCCNTLKKNRPNWNVLELDIKHLDGSKYRNIDLLAGGLPCPPFSVAGKQLGNNDERDLFPSALCLIQEIKPRAIMIENVRGILDKRFNEYREYILEQLEAFGYRTDWKLLNASDFGVSQLRPRAILVGIRKDIPANFNWPEPFAKSPPTVGEVLFKQISSRGWKEAIRWKKQANKIAPTIVGGSKKHGGPDLGPIRARNAWAALGVDGTSIAEVPPSPDFIGMPRLTIDMVARLQGFPSNWHFTGKKTPAYRQVGNAFPPPVAKAVGEAIISTLTWNNKLSERGVIKEDAYNVS